jgi:hypothetical protein
MVEGNTRSTANIIGLSGLSTFGVVELWNNGFIG